MSAEITNWKSGISLTYQAPGGGAATRGTHYAEEYLYFDKVVSDRKIVYIHDDTLMVLAHNANNIVGVPVGDGYEAAGTDVGVIKFKPDGDQHWELYPAEWISYSAPFAWEDLNYGIFGAAGTAVVGTTGRSGTLTLANKTTTYYRGMTDSFGDEYHLLTVADDDEAERPSAIDAEYDSSDGKAFLMVVNPVTPCLTWRVTGNGQFYTTVHKAHFIPVIHSDATTYFTAGTGTVTLEIVDINGGNISYAINGGSTVNVGASTVTLDQDDFNAGTNSIVYWITSTPGVTKTRTVEKNPAYPSADEDHGDKLWGGAAQFTSEVQPRFAATPLLSAWLNNWRNSNTWNYRTTITANSRAGKRNAYSWHALVNALVARWDSSTTAAGFAKLALFESRSILEPIGYELNTSNQPTPTRELMYRGYYDVEGLFSDIAAYDILVGHFRADQGVSGGITAIEDYFIRDVFGSFVHQNMLATAGYFSPGRDELGFSGMWETAMRVGGMMACAFMPKYSTPYFGTSGMDGNTTTFDDCPFPDVAYTWKTIMFDNNPTVGGFPNVHKNFGLEEVQLASDGNWYDKIGYTSVGNYGHVFQTYGNLIKLFQPSVDTTRFDLALARAATGTWVGLKEGGVVYRSLPALQCAFYESFRSVAQPTMDGLATSHAESLNKQLVSKPLLAVWHDHNLTLGEPPEETVAQPQFSPDGGTFDEAQNVTITSATPGATIRYTTNGTDPTSASGTVYSGPVAIGEGTTSLRAIAYNGVDTDSSVKRSTYTVVLDVAQVVAPTISPQGNWMLQQSVSITTPTASASVYITVTTDGSEPATPTSGDTLVGSAGSSGGTYLVTGRARIKAIAIRATYTDSAVTEGVLAVDYLATVVNGWAVVTFSPRTTDFSLTFDATPGESDNNTYVAVADELSESFGHADMTQVARFNSTTTGHIDARNGAAYAAANSKAYTGTTTYEIVVDFTFDENGLVSYDMSADGTVIASDYAPRKAATSLSTIVVWSGNSATLVAENFVFGVPTPPEDPRPRHLPSSAYALTARR